MGQAVGEHDAVGVLADVGAGAYVEGAAAIEEDVRRGDHLGAAAELGVVGQAKVDQLAGAAVVAGRDRPAARHQQEIVDDRQLALRRHAGEGVGLVRLFDEQAAVAVSGPNDLTGRGVHGVQEDAHERPDAGGEVDRCPLTPTPLPRGGGEG